jgi:uncharacterized protein (UPF0264 family)
MPIELLVSVRDGREAAEALRGGADLIDVKEPRAGSLGRPSNRQVAEVVEVVRVAKPVSVALGELPGIESDGGILLELESTVSFAKVGLAGVAGTANWRERLATLWSGLPPGVAPVAVVYADFESAKCPPPGEILDAARSAGVATILLDTYDKRGPGIVASMGREALRDLVSTVKEMEFRTVVGGKVALDDIPILEEAGADIIAVRSAVCDGDRTSRVSSRRVAEFRAAMGCHAV